VKNVPTASIIIPIYNAKKYLGRCLGSILNQTYQDFEVLCIDDGSKDSSYRLLQEYVQKYPGTIKIYTQENIGAGSTRNNGIRYSEGKYLFFIDDDDYIAENYIQTFVEEAEKTGADMVIGGYKRVDEDGKCIYWDRTQSDPLWEPFKRLAPWGRIYRKSFITKNKIKFLDSKIGEDNYFNVIAATISSKISVIDYTGYYWFFNKKSISNTQHLDPELEQAVVFMLKSIYNKLDFSSIATEKRLCVEYLFCKLVVFYLLFYGRKFGPERLTSAYKLWFSAIKQFFPHYRKNPLIGFLTPHGECLKTSLIVTFFIFLDRIGFAGIFLILYSKF
jgi:glycosyltransferase involved in cell wall biosynthesis